MLSRAPDMDVEPYYCLPVGSVQQPAMVPWSQPTSPTPPSRGFGGLLSPTHGNYRLTYPKKNDEGKFILKCFSFLGLFNLIIIVIFVMTIVS